MDIHTLVLDCGYQVVERTSWEEAFVKVYKGVAEVVEVYKDKIVRSATQEWQVPAVIRLITYHVSNKKRIKFSRANIYARDRGRCQYCSKKVTLRNYTMDHVVPRSKGGITKWENIVVSCWECNQKKGHKTLEESGMSLLQEPKKPKNLKTQFDWMDKNIPEVWKSYVYWFIELEQK